MKRFLWVVIVLVLALSVAFTVYKISFWDAVAKAKTDDRERLEVFAELVSSNVNRYKSLPFTVAHNRTILRLLEKRAPLDDANAVLKEIAGKSGASVIYILSPSGETIAASNYDMPTSFIGNNYNFRSYFKQALQGKEGAMYAIGVTSKVPGYYLSCPITFEGDEGVAGVAVAKLELLSLQAAWHLGHGTVLATDPYGIVIISSRSQWLYRSTHPLPEDELELIRSQKLYVSKSLQKLFTHVTTSGNAPWATIDNRQYLLSQMSFPEMNWNLYYLTARSGITLHSIQLGIFTFLVCLVGLTLIMFFQEHRRNALTEMRLEQARRNRRIDNEREESLRLLADSIAHQIRNPLLGIGGNANLLRKKIPEDDRLSYHIYTIIDCCHNLEGIVVSVRDYINLVPGQANEFAIGDAIHRARLNAENALIPQRNVNWSLSVEPVDLYLDEGLLVKALVEIFKNALEHADSDVPTIRVEGSWNAKTCTNVPEATDRCYYLRVCDNGAGMSPDILKHVMDPFFTTKANAIGLGLAKAKRVLQVFHGSLEVMSSPGLHISGCNTEVLLSLPVAHEKKAPRVSPLLSQND